MFSLACRRAYKPDFLGICPGPALPNKYINIWLIQNVIIKSGDHIKDGRTTRICTQSLTSSWKSVWKRCNSLQRIYCFAVRRYTGEKKSGRKIELYWCQSFRKRPTGYRGSQEHESSMSPSCEKSRYYTDKWSFCSALHWQDLSWVFLWFLAALQEPSETTGETPERFTKNYYRKDWTKWTCLN